MDDGGHTRKLSLDDIEDLRAYERGRQQYRRAVIALKSRRRVAVGPIVSLVFENRETVRSQIQEMARAEHMVSDEQIQKELDVYNPLIPEPGELSATLFIELSGDEALREWLPKLVGIEGALSIHLGAEALPGGDAAGGAGVEVVPAVPEQAHAEALTRDEVTASVHYLRFVFDETQVARFAAEPAAVVVDHPHYQARAPLGPDTKDELLADLRP
jgi:hypothetical protein